jgi:transcriptional regulator with GAF, ATPase, and Fis domain
MDIDSTTGTLTAHDDAACAKSVLALSWIFPCEDRRLIPLVASRYTIGRDPDRDIRLDSPKVSRHHAEIHRQGPIFVIQDLGSKNGIYVDGERLQHAPLGPGRIVRVGDRIAVLVTVANGTEGRDQISGPSSVLHSVPEMVCGRILTQVLEPLRRTARHDLSIILQGETGTGKELVARSVHAWSGRSGPFFAVNCATLPPAIADGELFGYRRGAFTGAEQHHAGYFRSAHLGTLFLDEVSELSLELQAKLLRALQEREVLPLGASFPVPIDIRVICASQCSLRNAVQSGAFRADLHARLDGYTCLLPPLRERCEDIPVMFESFIRRHSAGKIFDIEPKLVERLCLYPWPQNVREVEQLARRLIALHGHEDTLDRACLPEHMQPLLTLEHSRSLPNSDRKSYELRRLRAALRSADGNLTRAAAALGLSRFRAYRLMAGRTALELMQDEEDRPRES